MQVFRKAPSEPFGGILRRANDRPDAVRRIGGWRRREPGIDRDVLLHPEREDRHHLLPHPGFSLRRRQLQMGRTLGQHLHEAQAPAVDLELERFLDRLLRAVALLVVVQRNTLHVHRAVQPRDHLGDLDGLAREPGAAIRRRGRQLPHQRRRRHLASGHAVDGVVHEHERHGQADLRGLDDLGQADRGEIAVPLVADHDRLGVGQLVAEGDRRRPAVRRLRVADVEVVVQEDGAAHRRDGDRPVLHSQFLDRVAEELVHQPVATTRTIVGGDPLESLAVRVPLEPIVKDASHR